MLTRLIVASCRLPALSLEKWGHGTTRQVKWGPSVQTPPGEVTLKALNHPDEEFPRKNSTLLNKVKYDHSRAQKLLGLCG